MILLDTNVISEPLRAQADPTVGRWLNAQVLETLYLSAMTVAELRYGLAILPDGRKKQGMCADLEETLLPLFAGRILPFDEPASRAYAGLQADARKRGTPLPLADACIAAIAHTHGMIVAARDITPFANAGVETINPWHYK